MRTRIIIVAAPLALLAACGEGRVSEDDLAVEDVGMGLETPPNLAELPEPTENALETVDFSGTYMMTGLDGSETRLILDREAGSYTYVGPAGNEQTGAFETLGGSRIMIEDFGGRPGYFSVADGALYRLAGEDAAYDDVSAGSVMLREGGAAAMGAGGE